MSKTAPMLSLNWLFLFLVRTIFKIIVNAFVFQETTKPIFG